MVGRVVSIKMQKTVVVMVEKSQQHPLYKKTYLHRAKYKVHDERGEARVGDRVLITEARPISKEKNWRLVGSVQSALAGKAGEK